MTRSGSVLVIKHTRRVDTSARLLRLLSLLAARPWWTNGELATRLDVTERTIRRDIAKLRDLGYAVESDAGPWGGYGLGAGERTPPLVLDNEEALAVAVALREATFSGVLGEDHAALSALFKLTQILPRGAAAQLTAMDTTFVRAPGPVEAQIASGVLLHLTHACRSGERACLTYRDRSGSLTRRDVDPYRLVRAGRRWYLVACDVTRDEWRTFRVDRVERIVSTGRPVDITDPPDPAELVREVRASATYPMYVTFRLAMPLHGAQGLIPTTVGTHRPDGPDATVITVGGPDADRLAAYLLGLGVQLQVLSPDTVRAAVLRRVSELADANNPAPEG